MMNDTRVCREYLDDWLLEHVLSAGIAPLVRWWNSWYSEPIWCAHLEEYGRRHFVVLFADNA